MFPGVFPVGKRGGVLMIIEEESGPPPVFLLLLLPYTIYHSFYLHLCLAKKKNERGVGLGVGRGARKLV